MDRFNLESAVESRLGASRARNRYRNRVVDMQRPHERRPSGRRFTQKVTSKNPVSHGTAQSWGPSIGLNCRFEVQCEVLGIRAVAGSAYWPDSCGPVLMGACEGGPVWVIRCGTGAPAGQPSGCSAGVLACKSETQPQRMQARTPALHPLVRYPRFGRITPPRESSSRVTTTKDTPHERQRRHLPRTLDPPPRT